MPRAFIIIAATIVGLVLVLTFRPQAQLGQPALTTTTSSSASKSNGPSQTAIGTDQALPGGLGDIQVKVTASGGRITSVGLARLNVSGPQSQQITNSVIPQLEQQTLAAGSAAIHAVSGATYTSQAYATSLQAAIDQLAKNGALSASVAAQGASNGNGGLVQPADHDD
jgi:uncharacterized protein with FMN-binding domain